MGQVVEMVSERVVDQAWKDYVEKAILIADDPTLLCSRPFNEDLTRRYERWRKLFLLQEHVG